MFTLFLSPLTCPMAIDIPEYLILYRRHFSQLPNSAKFDQLFGSLDQIDNGISRLWRQQCRNSFCFFRTSHYLNHSKKLAWKNSVAFILEEPNGFSASVHERWQNSNKILSTGKINSKQFCKQKSWPTMFYFASSCNVNKPPSLVEICKQRLFVFPKRFAIFYTWKPYENNESH